MGIINFIKGGVHQLAIARPDGAKDYWVYKHPDQNIPSHAQLTVDSDEVALFFKDGKFVGALPPGRHTLDASNIPFLGLLVDKFTGGDVFICEVFFVTIREMPSIKFGTSIGDIQDPQTQLRVRLMVYGEFSAKVMDPSKFVIGIVGQRATDNDSFLGWFKSQVQKTMKDGIAALIVKQNWPLMKVTSGAYTEEIEATTLTNVRKDIEAYQQLAQAEMMMGAAEGMKNGSDGGGALQGAGIGLGFNMAGQFANMNANANAPHPAAAAPVGESKDQIMATLKQLGELKAAGVLTDAEFEAKKKDLLAKL